MKFLKPTQDYVVIKIDEQKSQTDGGLYIPDEAKKRPQRGKILAVGPGRPLESGKNAPMGLEVGQVVWFTEFSGYKIEVDSEELWVMGEKDVLCIEINDDDWGDGSDELHKS